MNDDARWQRMKEIFLAASELEGTERIRYLDEQCPDGELRAEVERLLTATQTDDGLLDRGWAAESEGLEEGDTLGHYRVGKRLGEGGMGVVYEAVDEKLHRTVVIKLISGGIGGQTRQRFAREAQIASSLNHPNIVTIHEIGHDRGMDFIAMEKVAGHTLREEIKGSGLGLKKALGYAVQTAGALAAAHEAGIVHRDFKPRNVMVTERGLIKVLDFGIAKRSADGMGALTRSGQVIGTPFYMSPEQAEGKPVDARSDIFSFGSVLFEMLTGQRAIQDTGAPTLPEIFASPPPLEKLPAAVPQSVRRILARCFEQKPVDRWQSMADVRVLLEEALKEVEAPRVREKRRTAWWWVAAACVAGIGAGWMGSRTGTEKPRPSPVLRMVTADNGLNTSPALSADGKLLAFASDRAKEGHLDIWLQQIGGRDPVRLTRDEADEMDPAFSPDGTKIAYRSEARGGGIFVIPSIGEGNPVLLAQGGRHPRFSPDGKWVAYWTGREGSLMAGSARTFIVEAGGGAPRPIHPEMASAMYPVWSPDGKSLMVLGRKEGAGHATLDWYILPLEGGTPGATGALALLRAERLTPSRQGMDILGSPLEWTGPAPGRLLHSAVLGDTANLWELKLSAGGKVEGPARRLTHGPGWQLKAVRADVGGAERMAFSDELLNYDIWSLDLDADGEVARGEAKRLTTDNSREWAPSLMWSGSRLTYLSRHAGIWSLRFAELPTLREQPLLFSPDLITTTRMAGDGSRVFYSDRNSDIYTVAVTGGVAEKLCAHCGEVTGASTDGSRLLYEPLENEDLLMFDVKERKTYKLALRREGDILLSGGRFSPDGKWVTFHALNNRNSTAQIVVVPVKEDGPAPASSWVAVTDGKSLDQEACWGPGGAILYFVSERDGFACLWARRLNAARQPSGEPFAVRHFHSSRQSLRRLAGVSALTGLAAGAGRIVYALSELTGNIWISESSATK